ncbi:ATPase [archaeon]|jgi:hypothetical protein|nr:ATPase [archaeon]
MTYVIKSTGEKERFDRNKVRKSILHAGASPELVDKVLGVIDKKRYDEIPTEKILDIVLKSLARNKGIADRYDLKRAIMQLGPSGFPFERFFAMVLKNYGYDVKVGSVLKGKNITHEIDVFAKGKNGSFMVECKYHNKWGIHTKVKIPLYVYARFLDLKKYFDEPWIVTNTKCTPDALNYARGVKMKVTSWNYPKGSSLRDLIEGKKLYPISVLRGVSVRTKEKLFESDIFLVKTLVDLDIYELKKKTKFSKRYLRRIIGEAKDVLGVGVVKVG